MNFFKFCSIALVGTALSLSSCGKDEPKSPEEPDNGGNGEMAVLTPQESKTFLSNTAQKFLGKFKPADQKSFVRFAYYFGEKYGDLDLPDNFDVEGKETVVNSPAKFISHLRRGVQSTSPSEITRAAYEYVYDINFKQFAGEYVPGLQQWVKKKDSSDIIFSFTDEDGKPCELKISPSDGSSDGTITSTYEEYDYWDEEMYSETVIINYSIPKTITFTLKQNDNVLASGHIKSKIDIKGHKLEADVKVSVANLEATSKLDGTDSKITQNAELKVSNETVLTEKAEINGNNLCNLDVIQSTLEKEESNRDDLLKFFSNGIANIDILGDVQLYGKMKLNRDVLEAFDNSYCEWGYGLTKSEAEEIINSSVKALNNNIEALLKYQNKSTTQASLLFTKGIDSWGGSQYGEYYVDGVMKFADDTTYSVEEYFSRGFASVADSWENLIESYEKMWESVIR